MSRIGNNRRGRPSKKERARIKFKTGIPFLDELYKIMWQHGIQSIADETGISESTMRDWVRGEKFPNVKKAHQILDHLGYELLIFEKDEPFEEVDR